jgi:DNA polymerase-3 subunit delta
VSETPPSVYLLDGDDEYAIAEIISGLAGRLGDPTTAEMNTTRLDGSSVTIEQVEAATFAMPFLAPRRLVILTRPVARLTTKPLRDRFIKLLNDIPPTTALVLVEPGPLTKDKERRDGKVHWLVQWVHGTAPRAFYRHCALPTGAAMAAWVQGRAKALGGTFTPQAAATLAGLVGDDPRLASQEINKLLAYVNYARPVEADDVEALTPLSAGVADFALLNALRKHDRRQAQSLLQRMLAEQDPIPLFHSIVSQFRDILLAREIVEARGTVEDVTRQLKLHSYRAGLAVEHARRYTLPQLETIYHRLLDLDAAIKTGQMAGDLALEMLVVELTG